MRRRSLSIVCLFFALLSGCESSARSNVSSNEVPHEKPLGQGVAVGDVTSRSALVWLRTDDAVTVQVEWQEGNQSVRSTSRQHDKGSKTLRRRSYSMT